MTFTEFEENKKRYRNNRGPSSFTARTPNNTIYNITAKSCVHLRYYELKTASGSRTSLVLPQQVKSRSGGYFGSCMGSGICRVNLTISMKRRKNNVGTVSDTGAGRVRRLNSARQ